MSRATAIIATKADRERLCGWIMRAPWNTRVEFKAPKRTLPQNDRMWALMELISAFGAREGVQFREPERAAA